MSTRLPDATRASNIPLQNVGVQAVSKRTRKPEVGSEELKDAILSMIVEKFGDRALSWETVKHTLSLVNFEIKQAAMFAPQSRSAG
jgi:hypothetical protein